MKNLFIIILLIFVSTNVFAKKVKFAVDMTDQTINATGVHVAGDFQTAAGFSGGDWQSNTTLLTKEGLTDIYSIVVDIPAMAKYEYKFLNGDQWYDVEFVPVESRVGYDFNDNRWLWLDSLSNDTNYIGAVLFGQNAPSGLFLVRFLVNMREESSISTNGVHLTGSFQEWSQIKTMLYSFVNNKYEIIMYMPSGKYEYKYINGKVLSSSEIVPSDCEINGNRGLQVVKDTVMETVCFNKCTDCDVSGIPEGEINEKYILYPNPLENYSIMQLNCHQVYNIKLIDVSGNIVGIYNNYQGNEIRIDKENLNNGIYFVIIQNQYEKALANIKLIIK